ncbi:MAG: hypothetical protein V7679_08995, partial [Parasphingorhabdus sp.]
VRFMAENPAIPPTDARRLATILLRGKMALGIIFPESQTSSFSRLSIAPRIIFALNARYGKPRGPR